MTVEEAISRTDRLKSNAFSREDKQYWLTVLEGQLVENIVKTHEPGLSPTGLSEGSPGDTVLLAPAPFDRIYTAWLEAMIDLYNGEIQRYNADIQLFDREYQAFESWYNRTWPPKAAFWRR